MYKKIAAKFGKLDKNKILMGVAVLAVIVTGVLISTKSLPGSNNVLSFLKSSPSMSADDVAKKSIAYLNESVLPKGQTATLESASKDKGLIKIKIKIGANTYDSYATEDGELLFPEAFNINDKTKTPATAQNTPNTQNNKGDATPANVAKVAKTSLEMFVVSSCPFGLQAERAAAQAIKSVPALADSVTVRFIGSVASSGKTITAMHGTEEAAENLRQICIREEQPDKFWSYVDSYIKVATNKAANGMPYGDSIASQTVAGVDKAKLNACVSDPARGIAYAKTDFALADKVGAQGSPTFALNGQEISETAFGGRSAYGIGNLVCSSSTNPPDFCKTALTGLNKTPASTSFSLTYAKDSAVAATASSNTACAPAVQ